MAACRQKHYPYPDECVFLVTGHRVDATPLSFANAAPLVVVSRTADRAASFFLSMASDEQSWEVVGCVSLHQLKGLRSRMTQPNSTQAAFKELKSGLIGSVLGHRQPWAISFLSDSGQPLEPEIVLAKSSSDVKSYIESTGKKSTGMFGWDMLTETIELLEKTQKGKAKREYYAIDYDGGELAQELAEFRAGLTPEERSSDDAIMARALRKQAAGVLR